MDLTYSKQNRKKKRESLLLQKFFLFLFSSPEMMSVYFKENSIGSNGKNLFKLPFSLLQAMPFSSSQSISATFPFSLILSLLEEDP